MKYLGDRFDFRKYVTEQLELKQTSSDMIPVLLWIMEDYPAGVLRRIAKSGGDTQVDAIIRVAAKRSLRARKATV